MMRYVLGIIVMIMGIGVMGYPLYNEHKQDREEARLLREFSRTLIETPIIPIVPTVHVSEVVIPPKTRELDKVSKSLMQGGAIGLIQIDSIDLTLPILEGATVKNMEHAATHISETTMFGEVGNVGIAAHRARKEGRLFSRLDEVKIGDKIIIKDVDRDYSYTVFASMIVQPEEVTVLNRNNVDSILTLVTCTYIGKETDRLIVQARLDE